MASEPTEPLTPAQVEEKVARANEAKGRAEKATRHESESMAEMCRFTRNLVFDGEEPTGYPTFEASKQALIADLLDVRESVPALADDVIALAADNARLRAEVERLEDEADMDCPICGDDY